MTAASVDFGHHAQNDRWIAEQVFPGRRDGYFVEAGACGGLAGSASFALERDLGWSGICVEPLDAYYDILVEHRSCDTDDRCLADLTGATVDFLQYPEDPARSGIGALNKNRETWALDHHVGAVTTTKSTVTLGDLLDQHGAPPVVDFLCLDVEGAERTILRAFDFDGPRQILAISVEGWTCDDLLVAHDYRRVRNPYAPDQVDHYFLHRSVPQP